VAIFLSLPPATLMRPSPALQDRVQVDESEMAVVG